jgi:hypothetical protein
MSSFKEKCEYLTLKIIETLLGLFIIFVYCLFYYICITLIKSYYPYVVLCDTFNYWLYSIILLVLAHIFLLISVITLNHPIYMTNYFVYSYILFLYICLLLMILIRDYNQSKICMKKQEKLDWIFIINTTLIVTSTQIYIKNKKIYIHSDNSENYRIYNVEENL